MKLKIGLAIATSLFLFACEKTPGVGGESSISGAIYHYQMNDNYSKRLNADLMMAQDLDVYIQYGDDDLIQDKIETSPNGYFEFNNLYEGDYKIIYYSENVQTEDRDKEAVIIDVSLDKDQSKDLGTLNYIESLDYDEGLASIAGVVKEVSFTYNSQWPNMIPEDTLLVLDGAVFIRPLHHQAYADRIRTQGDGSFYFNNLIPGDYEIYVFSEDIKGSDQNVSIKDTVTISSNTSETYHMDDLIIYNL